MGNNKAIGIILIVIGIAFITLGVWAGISKAKTPLPSIYTEQNQDNTQVNDVTDSIYLENINIYNEQNKQE